MGHRRKRKRKENQNIRQCMAGVSNEITQSWESDLQQLISGRLQPPYTIFILSDSCSTRMGRGISLHGTAKTRGRES